MEIKLIPDKNQWNDRLVASGGPFTQSWEWGDVLIAEGKKVERLAVVEGEQVLAQAQIIYSRIIFGWQYAFCPKGPIESSKLKVESYKVYENLIQYLKNKNCIFFRIEPELISNIQYPISNIKKVIDINPSATLILDLKKSEKELLASMYQKTRYNIHLAEKKDLKINQEKNLEVFWSLMNQTGARDKFKLHAKSHYEQVLNSNLISQLTVYFNNTTVATAVFVRFGNTLTYLYGASDYEYRHLMAPYLLQWEGIKMGKSLECERYDFFGVAPRCHAELVSASNKILKQVQDDNYDYDTKHQYAGVTRFKLGFGGAPFQAPGTFDVVIAKNKYKLYNLLRKLRRLF